MKRIIITGATGLIGSAIAKKLIGRREEVIVFSRSPKEAKSKVTGAYEYVKWNYDEVGDWVKSIENADAIIHLAGENVMSKRWNDDHKRKVLASRVDGTLNLVSAIEKAKRKPSVFVCASAIGYYDYSVDIIVDETSLPGTSFLSDVTNKWELAAAEVEKYGVRRVSIRIGIVLDKNDGALAKMITPFKFFVGGSIGSGKQWMPWIHIDDIANLFIYAIDNNLSGPLNGVASNPVRMKEFAKALGKVLNRPSLFPVPEFLLQLVIGEGAEVILNGSKVLPNKTIEMGYKFEFIELESALKDVLF